MPLTVPGDQLSPEEREKLEASVPTPMDEFNAQKKADAEAKDRAEAAKRQRIKDLAPQAENAGMDPAAYAAWRERMRSDEFKKAAQQRDVENFYADRTHGKWRQTAFEGVKDWTPEKAARVIRNAKLAHVPVDQAAKDPEFTKGEIILQNLPEDISKTLEENLSDPYKAAVLWDDLDKLDKVEKAMRPKHQVEALAEGAKVLDRTQGPVNATDLERLGLLYDNSMAQRTIGLLGTKKAHAELGIGDPLTPDEEQQYKDALYKVQQAPGEMGAIASFLATPVQSLGPQLYVYGKGTEYAAGAASAAAAATALRNFATAGPAALNPWLEGISIGAASLTAAAPAFLVGAAKATYEMETGGALAQYSTLKVDGQPLDPHIIAQGAQLAGGINAALEMLPEGFLVNLVRNSGFKFLGKQIGKNFIRRQVGKLLETATGRQVIQKAAGAYAALVATEGVTEGLQGWVTDFFGEWAKLQTSQEIGGDYTGGDVLDQTFSGQALARFGHEALAGANAAVLFALPGVMASTALDYASLNQQAKDEQALLDQVIHGADSMNTKKIAPELLQDYLNQEGKAKGYGTVYIDPQAVQEVEQELLQGGKDETVVPWLAGLKKKAEEAASRGGDVEMGLGDATDLITNQAEGQVLRKHIRLSERGMSQAEQILFREETNSLVTDLLKQANSVVQNTEEAKQIYDEHLTTLKEAGYTITPAAKRMAQLVPAWIAAKARMKGVSAKELAAELNLDIEGPVFSRDARAAKLPDGVFTDANEQAILKALETDTLPKGVQIDGLTRKKKDGTVVLDKRFARGWLREKYYRANPRLEQTGGRGSFNPDTSTIRLSHDSDLSTFIHEAAHFILDAETRLAGGAMTPLLGKSQTIAKETGLSFGDVERVVNGMLNSGDAYIKVHEYFAQEFERYLKEGSSPTVALQDTFSAARQWMLYVYQDTPEFFGEGVNPELKAMFDRMLTIDAVIQEQEVLNRYRDIMREEGGRPVEQKARNDKARADQALKELADAEGNESLAAARRQEKAIQRLTRRWAKAIKRERTKEWKDTVGHFAKKFLPDIQNRKEQRLKATMQTKEGAKLDRAVVKEMLGVKRVPRSLNSMTVVKGGIHPDELARLADLDGIDTGDQLLKLLTEMQTPEAIANQMAEAKAREIHGDMTNPSVIQADALELVKLANSEKVLKEFNRLTQESGKRGPNSQALKATAREMIDTLKVSELHPKRYHDAEIRAAKMQAIAEHEDNKELAAEYARKRLANYYLWKFATERKVEVAKAKADLELFKKQRNRDRIESAGQDYWTRMSVMLARVGLLEGPSAEAGIRAFKEWQKSRIDARESATLRDFVMGEGEAIAPPPNQLEAADITPFDDLTTGEALAVHTAIMSLRHAALNTRKVRLGEQEYELDKVADEVAGVINANSIGRNKTAPDSDPAGSTFIGKTKALYAHTLQLPNVLIRMQGHKRTGPLTRLFDGNLAKSQQQEHELFSKHGDPVVQAMQDRTRAERKWLRERHKIGTWAAVRKGLVPDKHLGELRGSQLVSAALNFGTQNNLQTFLEGWGLIKRGEIATIDHPFVQEVLNAIPENEMAIIKLTWKQIDAMFPLMQEVHFRSKGQRLVREEGIEISSKRHGKIKGGYYPIEYDTSAVLPTGKTMTEEQVKQATDQMFDKMGFRDPGLRPNATYERTAAVGPVKMDLSVALRHLDEIAHYISHYETVLGIQRIITDNRVKSAMTKAEGLEIYREVEQWVREVAGTRETHTLEILDDMAVYLRHGSTLAVLGFKVHTALLQYLGLVNTIGELSDGKLGMGEYRVGLALASVIKDPVKMWGIASKKSRIFKYRRQTRDRDMKGALDASRGESGASARVKDASMLGIAFMQQQVDLVSWVAAYNTELAKSENETQAIEFADSVVERIQGSGEAKNLASYMRRQRTPLTRLAFMFMTFFSSVWNIANDAVIGGVRGKYSKTEAATRLFYSAVAPTVVYILLKEAYEMLLGTEDEKDQDKTLAQKFLKEEMRYIAAVVPMGGYIYDIVQYQKTPTTAGSSISTKGLTAVASIGESGKLLDVMFGDEKMTDSQIKSVFTTVSALSHIPGGGQLGTTYTGMRDILKRWDDQDMTPLVALDEFLFGAPKK